MDALCADARSARTFVVGAGCEGTCAAVGGGLLGACGLLTGSLCGAGLVCSAGVVLTAAVAAPGSVAARRAVSTANTTPMHINKLPMATMDNGRSSLHPHAGAGGIRAGDGMATRFAAGKAGKAIGTAPAW